MRGSGGSVAFIAVLPDASPAAVLRQAAHLEGMLWKPVSVGALTDAIARARSVTPAH